MSWLLEAFITALFNFLAKLIGKGIKGALDKAENEKTNQEIKANADKAETVEESQAALNDAARHLGHH